MPDDLIARLQGPLPQIMVTRMDGHTLSTWDLAGVHRERAEAAAALAEKDAEILAVTLRLENLETKADNLEDDVLRQSAEITTLRARLAAAEKMAAVARDAAKWLRDARWGNYDYMEGSEVYGDIANHLGRIDSALAAYDATKEAPSDG